MKIKAMMIAPAAMLALAACGQKTEPTPANTTVAAEPALDNATAAAPAASPAQTFADAAAASDAFEMTTSQLALTTASSAAVKSYAQKMIAAHTESTAKLKAAAAAMSPAITPDATLSAVQQQKLDTLKTQTGAAFDKSYLAEQVEGHQAALDTLRAYAAGGDVDSLNAFATQTTPIVAAHLNMAKGLVR